MPISRQYSRWVLRAQLHDSEALEGLLREAQPVLYRYLAGMVGTQYAEDALQEVLFLICRNLGSLHTPELFMPWAYRIASREAFRLLKKQNRCLEMPYDEELHANGAAVPAWEPPDESFQNWPEMDVVPPASRAVLGLHFQQDLSLPEVAAILGIPLGTVKSRLAAGLTALRNCIAKERKP